MLIMKIPQMQLNSGHEMPAIGFGTFAWSEMKEHGDNFATVFKKVIFEALDAGYRHFDCARAYGNQPEVGAALKEAVELGKVKREELFIVTKIWNSDHEYEHAKEAIDQALDHFQTDYIDLMLIHTPFAVEHKFLEGVDNFVPNHLLPALDTDYLPTWRAMEEAVGNGKLRSIGLSNFNARQTQRVIDHGSILPAVNSVEAHPYFNQSQLGSYCKKHGIVLHAYWPFMNPGYLGSASLFTDKTVLEVAAAHKKSAGQVLLRWQLERGNAVVVKSSNPRRMRENADVFDFQLTAAELRLLNGLDRGQPGRCNTFEQYKDNVHYPFNDEY